MKPLDKTLKKIAAGISKENTVTSSNTEPESYKPKGLPGDPDCPICNGYGYIRRELPVDHPDFGKLTPCICLQKSHAINEYQHLSEISNIGAYKTMTFENFKPQGRVGLAGDQINSLNSAYNQAFHFAQGLNGWLFLSGGYGCGKTHLAAAIANYALEHGVETLFQTVPDLLDWARSAYFSSDTNFTDRFEKIRNVRLLILDDLGTENETPWAQEKLFQIINHRYVNRLPTVVTTNLGGGKVEERIWSRLQDPDLVLMVKISAPDYRTPMHDSTQLQLSSLHLHHNHTFGNFSLREREHLNPEEQRGLEKAFQAAHDFAENPQRLVGVNGQLWQREDASRRRRRELSPEPG